MANSDGSIDVLYYCKTCIETDQPVKLSNLAVDTSCDRCGEFKACAMVRIERFKNERKVAKI